MQPIVRDDGVAWSAVTFVYPARTAEQIETRFSTVLTGNE